MQQRAGSESRGLARSSDALDGAHAQGQLGTLVDLAAERGTLDEHAELDDVVERDGELKLERADECED